MVERLRYNGKVIRTQTATVEAEIYYTADGQIVGKKTKDKVSIFSWDGNVLAGEDNVVFTNEAHVSGGVPILISGKDVISSDHLGNTLSMGHQKFASTAYGEGSEGGRFTGKPHIKELGSFAFIHRLYSPEFSRWSTSDPLGYPDGFNNFEYCASDPLTKFDRYGTSWEDKYDVPGLIDDYSYFPTPGEIGIEWEQKFSYGLKWDMTGWETIGAITVSSAPRQRLIGTFSMNMNVQQSITIGPSIYKAGVAISEGGSWSTGVNEAGTNYNQRAFPRVSKANVYNMKRLFTWYDDAWHEVPSAIDSEWVSNLLLGKLYPNHLSSRIQEEK